MNDKNPTDQTVAVPIPDGVAPTGLVSDPCETTDAALRDLAEKATQHVCGDAYRRWRSRMVSGNASMQFPQSLLDQNELLHSCFAAAHADLLYECFAAGYHAGYSEGFDAACDDGYDVEVDE